MPADSVVSSTVCYINFLKFLLLKRYLTQTEFEKQILDGLCGSERVKGIYVRFKFNLVILRVSLFWIRFKFILLGKIDTRVCVWQGQFHNCCKFPVLFLVCINCDVNVEYNEGNVFVPFATLVFRLPFRSVSCVYDTKLYNICMFVYTPIFFFYSLCWTNTSTAVWRTLKTSRRSWFY